MPRKRGGKFCFQQMTKKVESPAESSAAEANAVEPTAAEETAADPSPGSTTSVSCSLCSAEFSSQQYLQAHEKYTHEICNICDTSVNNLEVHSKLAHYSVALSTDVWVALKFYSSIPSELLPYEKRKLTDLFKTVITVNLANIDIDRVVPVAADVITDRLHQVSIKCKTSFSRILVPPTKDCLHCDRRLTLANPPIHVILFDECGPIVALKYTYRCRDCPVFKGYVIYTLDKYSSSESGLSFYNHPVNIVKSTNRTYFSRSQVCSFTRTFFHCWASFSGNSEAYNDSKLAEAAKCQQFLESINDEDVDLISDDSDDDLGPSRRHILDRKVLSRAFRIYFTEEELRERNLVSSWSFKDDELLSTYDEFMEFVDKNKGAYQHVCTQGCLERGCKKVYVMDGIWKLSYPHCMFYNPCKDVNTDVSLPPVCTKAPKHSMAFCEHHCEIVEKLGHSPVLRNFLREAGADDKHYTASGQKKVDSFLYDLYKKSGMQSTEDSLLSQGVHNNIRKSLRTRNAANNLSASDSPSCNHETNGKQRLQKYSRGHLVIVEGGGHIAHWAPLYKSEGPAQVAMIVLTFLLTCIAPLGKAIYKNVWLAYDNMCHLASLNLFKKPLTFMGTAKNIWFDINKIIDGLHINNHTELGCHANFHPNKLKEVLPNSNTMVAEQTFSWLGRFKRVLNNMGKTHHHFFLHRLFIMRNEYNTRMYKLGISHCIPQLLNQLIK